MPLSIWLAAAGVGLFLLALCGVTAYAMLRARIRQRIAGWPAPQILGLLALAVVPWLVVWLAPIQIVVNIKGLLPLLGWLLLGVGAFALLVLLPLVALISAGIWWVARGRAIHSEGPMIP